MLKLEIGGEIRLHDTQLQPLFGACFPEIEKTFTWATGDGARGRPDVGPRAAGRTGPRAPYWGS